MFSCCGCEEPVQEVTSFFCEYYGCLPKLTRLDGSDLETCEPLPPSAVNTFTAQVPQLYGDPSELPPQPPHTLRVVVISDTHERHREMLVPNGDLLVHGGDLLEGIAFWRNKEERLQDFFDWFNDLSLHPHSAKVLVGGNHDKLMAKMSREAIRSMAAPALYLEDESAVLKPLGLRIFGSPRSTENSWLSRNKSWQSPAAWKPFPEAGQTCRDESMRRPLHDEDELLPVGQQTPLLCVSQLNTTTNGAAIATDQRQRTPASTAERDDCMSQLSTGTPRRRYALRLEGEVPLGPVDVLLTHQTPEYPSKGCPLEKQPIMEFFNSVRARRVYLGGHLHGSHGFHQLPVPPTVAKEFGYVSRNPSGEKTAVPLPFFPCINTSMMQGSPFESVLLPASVIDIAI